MIFAVETTAMRSAVVAAVSGAGDGPEVVMVQERHHSKPGASPLWPLRTEAELLADQLEGIAVWSAGWRAAQRQAALTSLAQSREMRLDLARRMEVRRREHAGLIARAAEHLEQGGRLLAGRARPRALVVHRNSWLCRKVADRLEQRGVQVIGTYDDGADGSGVLVVEQPDLVLVEDRLPSLSGLELVQRAARFAPHTAVAAQLLEARDDAAYRKAGARAVFSRRTPPVDIADALVDCLGGRALPG